MTDSTKRTIQLNMIEKRDQEPRLRLTPRQREVFAATAREGSTQKKGSSPELREAWSSASLFQRRKNSQRNSQERGRIHQFEVLRFWPFLWLLLLR